MAGSSHIGPASYDDWREIGSVLITGQRIEITYQTDQPVEENRNPRWTVPPPVALPPGTVLKNPLRPGMELAVKVDDWGVVTSAALRDPDTENIEIVGGRQPRQRWRPHVMRTKNGASRTRDLTDVDGPQSQLEALLAHDPFSRQTTVTHIWADPGGLKIHTADGHQYRHPTAGELLAVPDKGDQVTVWEYQTKTARRPRGLAYGPAVAWYVDERTCELAMNEKTSRSVGGPVREVLRRDEPPVPDAEVGRLAFGDLF